MRGDLDRDGGYYDSPHIGRRSLPARARDRELLTLLYAQRTIGA